MKKPIKIKENGKKDSQQVIIDVKFPFWILVETKETANPNSKEIIFSSYNSKIELARDLIDFENSITEIQGVFTNTFLCSSHSLKELGEVSK